MSLFAFACRRVLLRPLRSGLLALAVLSVTLLLGSGLLVLGAIEVTADAVVAAGPSLVVAKVDAGGWAPLPVGAASALSGLPGVVAVRARVWGILPGQPPMTVVGDPALPEASALAVAGSGLPGAREGGKLALTGLDGQVHWVEVSSLLPAETATVARDLLIVSEGLARRLLLVPDGLATDLAVTSIRPEEDAALVPVLAAALGFPVRVTTRAQMRGAFRTLAGARGGLWLLFALPAVLGLVLVVGQVAAGGANARVEAGRLKLLGWTTWDVARLHLWETLVPAGLAAGVGLVAAYAGVFLAGGGPAAATLLGYDGLSPGLLLATSAAPLALAQVGAAVLLPCALAALMPAARLARADPSDLLEAS